MKEMRRKFVGSLAAAAAAALGPRGYAADAPALVLPEGAREETWDFAAQGIDDWTVVTGQWSIGDSSDAPSGKPRVLRQRAVQNEYNVIVAPLGPYSDVDVSVSFKPISGREDASGGVVLRFSDGKYYVIRANALEDNFRFYYYERSRQMLSSARVRPPALGRWHTVRVVMIGDRLQGWLDGMPLLDHRDRRFKAGRIGLWTKTDSITDFDGLSVRGIRA